jgi:hypothetical protein
VVSGSGRDLFSNISFDKLINLQISFSHWVRAILSKGLYICIFHFVKKSFYDDVWDFS